MTQHDLRRIVKQKNKICSDENIDYLFLLIFDELKEYWTEAYKEGVKMTQEVYKNGD